MEQSAFGTSCLGPLAGLEKQRALYEATVKALANPARTTMVWAPSGLAPVVTRDPVLAARRATEAPYLAEVRSLSRQVAVVGLAREPPRGAERLLGLVASS